MDLVLVEWWRVRRRFSQELEPVMASENWAKPERRFHATVVRIMSDIICTDDMLSSGSLIDLSINSLDWLINESYLLLCLLLCSRRAVTFSISRQPSFKTKTDLRQSDEMVKDTYH